MDNKNRHLTTLYIIIGVLILSIFLQRSCIREDVVIANSIKYDTIFKNKELPSTVITKYVNVKGDTVFIPGKVNVVEVKKFEKAPDTAKLKLYTDATKIRSYNSVFNNKDADISIYTETKGELLKIVPTVNIKQPKEVKSVFALYGGAGLYNNTQFSNPGLKFDLGVQLKKGDIIEASYDTNKNIYLSYKMQLINIKK